MAVIMNVKGMYIIIVLTNLFWFSDCKLAAFKQLQDLDNEITSFTTSLYNTIIHHDTGLEEVQKEALKNIVVAGSTQEGTMTARVFEPTTQTNDGLNREVQIDLEYKLIEIPASNKHIIEDIHGKEGFVKVHMTKDILRHLKVGWKMSSKEYEKIRSKVSKDGYLKPYVFKQEVLKRIQIRNRDDEIKLVLSAALDVNIDSITLSHPREKSTKPSFGSHIDIVVDNELKVKVSWDIVAVIKLNWWPKVATEWTKRERKWPSKDIIKDLTRFSYVTSNPSNEGKLTKDGVELRYSFADTERVLSSMRSPQQALVYLVFKSMVYKWIKPIDTNHIHTYITKTVMLWTCENYPPEHPIWDETSTIETLTFLFNELLKAIKDNNLPNYFIPKLNVIKNIKGDIRGKLIHQIKEMLLNIEQVLPDNVNEAIITCREILNMAKSTYKVMDDVNKEYYDIFLKRPDLIPKALEIYGSHLLNIGNKKKEELNKQFDDVKDTLHDKWNQFQDDIDFDEVKKNVQEKIDQVKDHLNLNDLEKKAKDFLKKFEL